MPKENRKQIILQSLASLLEERNLSKVTTALLAEKSSITEAALYRHFPSKRSIYLELFSFCDETIISKSANEQNVVDATNQFYERLELNFKQILQKDSDSLLSQPGISSHLLITSLEGTISRYIRSKFKEKPSSYIENIWTLLQISLFK